MDKDKLFAALIEIGKDLTSTIELDEVLHRILKISREIFRFENAIIRLLDEERRVLVTAASYGYSENAVRPEIPVGRGVMGSVAETGSPILISDLSDLPDYVPGIEGARSELAVPLKAGEKVIGVFNVESPKPGLFRPEDVEPLMIMASQAAIALENARLYESMRTISARFRDLHQLNSRILESVSLGIYTVDAAMRITSWNRKMAQMSGVAEDAAVGRNLLELFPILREEGFADRIRQVLQTGTPERLRLAHQDQKGQLRFQKRRLAPLNEEGRTHGVVVIVEDITEFKSLMEQIIQSEKLAEMGRLSAGIAHEINNPLAVISYASQLILREESLPESQRELAERIENEVDRLKTLTGGFLSFSRAAEMRKRDLNLNEVLRDVLRFVRFELIRHSIEVKTSFGDLPAIRGDGNKLKQVFLNLITNASQAMRSGGTLVIETRPLSEGEVEVVISDTGPGIPPNLRERIFEPFFTTKAQGEGTGLGLYICRNIVAEHGGRILMESADGAGTTFRILFALDREEEVHL